MAIPPLHPRFAAPQLALALADTPVVLIHGPRQCGKTTLARQVGEPMGYAYLSFDEPGVLAAARNDPSGFVADLPGKVILDEVQKVPALFSVLKLAVDRNRTPGRFLLTGSAQVLLVPRLSDSLAGRMGLLRLHPLSQCELAGAEAHFLDRLFRAEFGLSTGRRLGLELVERIVAGGFPPALARKTSGRRSAWYRDYLETLVARDVYDLSRIASLEALPRLLALAASQTGQLLNVTSLAAPFGLTRPTIRDYLTLLERVYMVEELPAWHSNQLNRLVKSPKLHMGDTGLACALLDRDAAGLWQDRAALGPLLETFVLQELRRQADWSDRPTRFFHNRDKDQVEVDVVAERGAAAIAGIEVKTSGTVTGSDFTGLRRLRQIAGSHFKAGVVLYDGETCLSFGDRLFAVPVRALWESAPTFRPGVAPA
jgi:predicted AAA+ superfamily ATPase